MVPQKKSQMVLTTLHNMKRRQKKHNHFLVVTVLLLLSFALLKINRSFFTPKPSLKINTSEKARPIPPPPKDILISKNTENVYVFVPYWNIPKETIQLPHIINDHPLIVPLYFGLKPTETGVINRDEQGYLSLDSFIAYTEVTKTPAKYLVIRMVNTEENLKILQDHVSQKNLIDDTWSIALSKGFTGVVLDLELSVLPTEKIKDSITSFSLDFDTAMKSHDLLSFQTLYGDVFYRLRPYEVKKISQVADGIFLMLYDFHKASGSPGPNFPLAGDHLYGYSLTTLFNKLASIVPSNKLVPIFGMYGYNWTVDFQNRPLKPAKAQRLRDIQAFIPSCKTCLVTHDLYSKETQITYENDGANHVIWYETTDSISQKYAFLQELGIVRFGLWAYGYW
ncbi:MAG: glycosyl hydrolase family 18 protein [Candidatus Roizmanbacteria bacterium]